jgi:antirestriction protein ArdC
MSSSEASPSRPNAECSAAYLCAEAGISPAVLENQAAYIQGWAAKIRSDKRMVVVAAAQAQKAADYILNAAPALCEA